MWVSRIPCAGSSMDPWIHAHDLIFCFLCIHDTCMVWYPCACVHACIMYMSTRLIASPGQCNLHAHMCVYCVPHDRHSHSKNHAGQSECGSPPRLQHAMHLAVHPAGESQHRQVAYLRFSGGTGHWWLSRIWFPRSCWFEISGPLLTRARSICGKTWTRRPSLRVCRYCLNLRQAAAHDKPRLFMNDWHSWCNKGWLQGHSMFAQSSKRSWIKWMIYWMWIWKWLVC